MLHKENMHDYQKVSVEHVIDNDRAGLLLTMGLGKTVSTLTAIEYLLYQELAISGALAIAPKRVVESVWKQEAVKWSHLKHMKITRIVGTAKQRIAAIKEPSDVHLISRDNVAWMIAELGDSLPWDMLIVDESSSFKNHRSKRFKAIKRTLNSFKRVVILTGTPAPNSLIDLWPQIFMLDQGQRLGRTIGEYRRSFFKPGRAKGHIVYDYKLDKGGDEKIHNAISDICISMKSSELLDLKGRVNNVIEIQLPKEARAKYDELEKNLFAELVDSETNDAYEILPATAAVLSNKLLQMANGTIYDEERNAVNVHDAKLKALYDLVDDANGEPVLIAYTYKHDLERIMKALKVFDPVKLRTDDHIVQWNNKEIRVLVTHPASAGHGLNMQAGGNIIVWYGQTWSLELAEQFDARLDRQGQTELVVVNHLVAKDTIDQDVISARERKSAGQQALMDAVKARIKKYKNLLIDNK